jgi:hypothetical protein
MSYVVFWIEASKSEIFPSMSQPMCRQFDADKMTEALAFTQEKRGDPCASHVTLSSENPDSVGRPGVHAVEDGRLPDGSAYGWKKRRA